MSGFVVYNISVNIKQRSIIMNNVLDRLASSTGRRDDEPNRDLAKELADSRDKKAISVIAKNLWNKDKKIRTDCLKVIYEIGYFEPDLIKNYGEEFVKLLKSNDNRFVSSEVVMLLKLFVWGSMIALSTIAVSRADLIIDNYDLIIKTIENGSVITVDSGINTLSKAASVKDSYNKKIFPYLISHLKKCRPKEVAQHSESIFLAVNKSNQEEFLKALHSRERDISQSQLVRIRKIYKKLQ